MGEEMAKQLLSNDFTVNIFANKNRKPVDRLAALGAIELSSITKVAQKSCIIILCLPNSQTVNSVLVKIIPNLKKNTLIIDCTTNDVGAVEKFQNKILSSGLRYAEAPLTGGQKQAEIADLGAIVGCKLEDFDEIKNALGACCQTIVRFGEIGSGAKAKLVSNFLALGTATLVVEALKAARDFGVDWEKFYKLASKGSGNSMSLERIAPKAINGDFDSYLFSIDNTLKDLFYIHEFFETGKDYGKIAQLLLEIYQESNSDGNARKFISNRLDPNYR